MIQSLFRRQKILVFLAFVETYLPPKSIPKTSRRQIQMGMGLVMSTSSQSSYSNSWKYSPPVVRIRGVDTPLVGVLT